MLVRFKSTLKHSLTLLTYGRKGFSSNDHCSDFREKGHRTIRSNLNQTFTGRNEHTHNSQVLTAISMRNRHPMVSQNYCLNDTAWKGGDCATAYFYLKVFPFCATISEENLVYRDLV